LVIAVASGKGGTGKTTVATNLAAALARQGQAVDLLDCDVEEPNDHLFFAPVEWQQEQVYSMVPVINEAICNACGLCARDCAFHALAVIAGKVLTFPELCHGCGGCAQFCPCQAISEGQRSIGEVLTARVAGIDLTWGRSQVGTVLTGAVIQAVRHRANPNRSVIIDAPPGTTCPTVAAISGVDLCLLVTEPTPFGLHDLQLAVEMARSLQLPVSVVVNRTGDMQADMLGKVKAYCQENNTPVLLEIPLSRELAACCAQGHLWVNEYERWQKEFTKLWSLLEKQVA